MTTNLRTLTCQWCAADVRDDDVQPRAVGERGVDEGRAEVDAAAAGLEHPLDEVAHLVGGQDRRSQLGDAATRDEHPARLVDPDLLDGRVVEVLLQRRHSPPRPRGSEWTACRMVAELTAIRRGATARRSPGPRPGPGAAPPAGAWDGSRPERRISSLTSPSTWCTACCVDTEPPDSAGRRPSCRQMSDPSRRKRTGLWTKGPAE